MDEENKPNAATESEIVRFSEGSSFNVGMLLTWISLIVAVGATAVFWLADRNVKSALNEKKQEKDAIIVEISNSTYADVEKRASDFRVSVSSLKKAKQDRYSYQEFLSQFYKNITNDVQLKNLTISDTGDLSLDGTTTTYRTTADLVLALTSWQALSDVKLGSVSFAAEDGKPKASFSITAKINKTFSLTNPAQAVGGATSNSGSNTSSTGSSASSTSASGSVNEPAVSVVGQ
jgi:Tfp pilus assembly protein PilN